MVIYKHQPRMPIPQLTMGLSICEELTDEDKIYRHGPTTYCLKDTMDLHL